MFQKKIIFHFILSKMADKRNRLTWKEKVHLIDQRDKENLSVRKASERFHIEMVADLPMS